MVEVKKFRDWTEQDHGDLLAGLITGMKFMSTDEDIAEEDVTLQPVGVGGKKGFGITVSTEEVDENSIATLSVYTRNVEESTAYGMFSVNLSWDNNRCALYQVENSPDWTFGTNLSYTIKPGNLSVVGQRDDGKHFSEPQLLFKIKFAVVGLLDKNNPIPIKHNITNNYYADADDILDNYTTILQMRKGVWGFISGIDNVNGLIVSEKKSEKHNVDDGGNIIPAFGSPTMVAFGSATAGMGDIGLVPIFLNVSSGEDFLYSGFSCEMTLNNTDAVEILGFVGVDGWSLGVSDDVKIGRLHSMKITGSGGNRGGTVGYMQYTPKVDEYSEDLYVFNANLIGGSTAHRIASGDGYIYFGLKDEFPPSPGGTVTTGGTGDKVTGNGGGHYISGTIWSPTSQIIWVSIGSSVKVPVYLKPGDNDVNVYIPHIFEDDVVEDGTLQIESEDYIWIPAGFKIKRVPPLKEPAFLYPITLVDKIYSSDVFYMHLEKIQPPVDLDNIIDEIVSSDDMMMEIRKVTRKYIDNIEEINSLDDIDVNHWVAQVPIDLGLIMDELTSIDIEDIVSRGIDRKTEDSIEIIDSNDDIGMKFATFNNIYCLVEGIGEVTGCGVHETGDMITLRVIDYAVGSSITWYIGDTIVSSDYFYRFRVTEDLDIKIIID